MITTLAFALGAVVCTTGEPALPAQPESPNTHQAVADSTYKSLYEGGEKFADFVAKATARKEQWEANYAKGIAPDALVTRANASGTGWKLLVVTVPGCSDSVNIVPYVASLLDKVPGVEMRLIAPAVGKAVQESHRTPDGRAATPTFILLDAEFNEKGCWIERPSNLNELMKNGTDFNGKMAWYDKDQGASSLEEIVQVIEAAHAGTKKCAPNAATP